MVQTSLTPQLNKLLYWRAYYIWLASIFYFCQGFYMAGFGLYAYTRMADWVIPAKTQAMVVAFLGLPLYLKFIPGLLSDRTPYTRWGRRKPFIVFGALLYLPGFLLLITADQFGPLWLSAILLVLLAWMLVDSSLDALTVDITPTTLTGRLQGSAWGARLIGYALGGLFVSLAGPRFGWTPTLIVLGVFALAQSAAPLAIREFPPTTFPEERRGTTLAGIGQAFKSPLIWLSLGFFILFDARGFSRVINIYLLSGLGWNSSAETMRTYGLLITFGTFASALGALLAGRLPVRWQTSYRFYVLFVAVLWILALPWLVVYAVPENIPLIFAALLLTEFTAGMSTVLMLALTMRVCPAQLEGFTFAMMTSVRNFATNALAPNTALAFSDRLGLVPSIFTLLPYGLLSLVLLKPLLGRLNQAAEPLPEQAELQPA